jgi:sodium/glutamate symporter
MSAGMCGIAIGSTPNAVANMDSVIVDNGPAPIPMAILPPVVSIALSVLNPIFITMAIQILS